MGKIGIIIGREFNERVRKKSFIITTILTPLLIVGVIVIVAILSRHMSPGVKDILVNDRSGLVAGSLMDDGSFRFRSVEGSFETITGEVADGKYGEVFGILEIDADVEQNPRAVRLYTYGSSTVEVEESLSRRIEDIVEEYKLRRYDIDNLPQILAEVRTDVTIQAFKIGDTGEAKESSSALSMILAYVFGFLIYTFVFIYGGMVMQGVIEEKSSKVIEVMVSSVKPFELMMGKILGVAAVALTQFFIWVVVIMVGAQLAAYFFMGDMLAQASAAMDTGMVPDGMDPETMAVLGGIMDKAFLLKIFGGFIVYFIGGYLLYAAMFAAIGSAVDNVGDTQQLQVPVTVPIFLALVVMINVMRDPAGQLGFWFGLIPFTSPIIIVARLPYGVPFWEVALSVALLFATFLVMVWFAGKIYRVGIFMYGKKPTFGELAKWIRYKS